MWQASTTLDQSSYYYYVINQLARAVEDVLVFIAESDWRGGEQKNMENGIFDKFDRPNNNISISTDTTYKNNTIGTITYVYYIIRQD